MRKLLLLANFLVFILIVASCCNVKKTETVSGSVSDPQKSSRTVETTGSEGMKGRMKSDTLQSHGNGNAIIHHGPNEAKIDSIKNAKNKK